MTVQTEQATEVGGGLSGAGAARSWGVGAAALALTGAAALLADQALPAPAGLMAQAALGVGALSAFAAMIVLRLRRAGAARRESGAFDALFGSSSSPAALSDFNGILRAVNPAMHRLTHCRPGEDVRSIFSGDAAKIEKRVYRMLREMRRDGVLRRETFLRGGELWDAEVAPAGAGVLLWRLLPCGAPWEDAGAGALAAATAFGFLRVQGGRASVNRALAEMIDGPVEKLEDVFAARPVRSGEAVALARPVRPGLRCRAFFDETAAAKAPPEAPMAMFLLRIEDNEPDGANAEDILEGLPVALARLTPEGRLISANAPARALLGPRAEPGAPIGALIEGLGRSIDDRVAEAARGRATGRSEIARGKIEDRELFLQVSLSRVMIDGAPSLIAVLSDATELKTLEAQFVQSQKMQAVGQLAGGVAHDFNNLLTAINGHCDLLLMRRDTTDPDHADLAQIRQNGNRAAALVRQMLAFSRKQTLRPKVISLVETLAELSHLLNRLLGEKVRLHLDHEGELGLVRVDERQFEQVIMNLVVNARDAMRDGGEVRVRTRNVSLSEEFRRDRAVVPAGDYVLIEVSDSGAGIPPDKIGNIFEPFFTTKKVGEGTGLGLSTAYGIVKQTGGFIFADSAPGEGAVFSIYLPRHEQTEAPVAIRPAAPEAAQDLGGEGVVLLAEDEAPVRSFAARALRMRGYEVVEADSAESALKTLEDPAIEIDVIVSDVVMPGMDGPTWVKRAREKLPDVKVIFVSGYAEDAFRKNLEGLDDFHFLPKPFSLNELSMAIKEVRDAA